MPNDCITYQNSGYFSKLIIDYLDEKPELRPLYHRYPKIEHFKAQIEEKANSFNGDDNFKRQVLVTELEKQYQNFEISETTSNNIKLLKHSNTFTITTGHQLNLFTGPLYFLYKIISTLNLCKELKLAYPAYHFVPIYWMATEDHDFEEINYFNFKGKKIKWNRDSFGPVGRLSTDGLEDVLKQFSDELGIGDNAAFLGELFQKSYLENKNLADATRFLANELFKNEGLVILDGDSKALKQLFVPYVKEELLNQTSYKNVSETIRNLEPYTIQVNPREINLFYLEDNLRERIVFEEEKYKVLSTQIEFTREEILVELENHPEKFSPNVILRPLYQEVVLPNLCYIGGGGEIAYWFELKSNFEAQQVTFPILLLRNSVLLITQKQNKKIDKLELSWSDLFGSQEHLFNLKTKQLSSIKIDFSEQKAHLKKQFEQLYEIAYQTDQSFVGAVKAQEAKQIKGLEHLEKRLLKAEKRVLHEQLQRIKQVQDGLFPHQSLQERQVNFSEFYVDFGAKLLRSLYQNLRPLEHYFTIINL